LFDHPVDPRGVYKGVNGKGMELGKGKRMRGVAHSCVAVIGNFEKVRFLTDRKNWLYEYDHHPKKEAGQVRTKIASFIIRFELLFSFSFCFIFGCSICFATIAVP
jgi:hypothetical protein